MASAVRRTSDRLRVSMKNVVYILKSLKNGRFYIGSTNDLIRRLAEHTNGQGKYTKNVLPLELLFSQEFSTLTEARKMERRLKNFKNREILERIIQDKKIRLGP